MNNKRTNLKGTTESTWLMFPQNGYPVGYRVIRNPAMARDNGIGYSSQDSGTWVVNSGVGAAAKPMYARFKRFDIQDTKRCDTRDKNDQDWSFKMAFKDGDIQERHMCHTIGHDKVRHQRQRTHNRSFRSGNPRSIDIVKKGENMMAWVPIPGNFINFEFMVGAKVNGKYHDYQGFEIEIAHASDLEHETLQTEIIEQVEEITSNSNMKAGKQRAVKKFFEATLKKANKQNAVQCVSEVDFIPEFLKQQWDQISETNNINDIVQFLFGPPSNDAHENAPENMTGYRVR